jgi:hypothetical protein
VGVEREGNGGLELLIIVLAGVVLSLVAAVWLGAWLALAISEGPERLPFSAAVNAAPQLPTNLSAPAVEVPRVDGHSS